MTRESIIVISAIAIYLVWLIVFVLVIEPWLRRLAEWLFGVTIEREVSRPVGQADLVDALFLYGWRVAEPAGLGLRLTVGFLRITVWLLAVIIPVVIGAVAYLYYR